MIPKCSFLPIRTRPGTSGLDFVGTVYNHCPARFFQVDGRYENHRNGLSVSCLPTIQPFELRSQRKRAEDGPFNYGVPFGSADRQHGLSLGHGRRRTSPLRLPLVPQPGRSARRAERPSSAGCCIGAPSTSAAVLPRERSGARKHQTPWAC